jgi:hypothetical protein
MVEGAPEQARDFVVPWMKIAEAAVPRARAAAAGRRRPRPAETEVVRLSLANLMTFPWIKEAVQAKRLALHGARFGIRSGVLEMLKGDRLERWCVARQPRPALGDLEDRFDLNADVERQGRHPDGRAAWRPRSPKTSTNRSEQPLMTLGWSVNSGPQFTMPSTFTARVTLSRLPAAPAASPAAPGR